LLRMHLIKQRFLRSSKQLSESPLTVRVPVCTFLMTPSTAATARVPDAQETFTRFAGA